MWRWFDCGKIWSHWLKVQLCFTPDLNSIIISVGNQRNGRWLVDRRSSGLHKWRGIYHVISFVPVHRELACWCNINNVTPHAVRLALYHVDHLTLLRHRHTVRRFCIKKRQVPKCLTKTMTSPNTSSIEWSKTPRGVTYCKQWLVGYLHTDYRSVDWWSIVVLCPRHSQTWYLR